MVRALGVIEDEPVGQLLVAGTPNRIGQCILLVLLPRRDRLDAGLLRHARPFANPKYDINAFQLRTTWQLR